MEWGFDLTDFKSAESFKNLLRRHKLASGYKRVLKQFEGFEKERYYHYTWSRKGLKLITGNNPLTGVYSIPNRRQLDKGYASYIGIKGRDKDVKALAMDIKKTARYIKDESPGKRDFI